MEPEYVIDRNATLRQSDIESLREAVGWDRFDGKYDRILRQVYTHYSVRSHGTLIGFTSVLSDGIGDAYIVDLMVHPDFQARGIGTALVKRVIIDLRDEGVKMINVVFDDGLEPFYKRFGFHIVKAGIIDNETMDVDLQEMPAKVIFR